MTKIKLALDWTPNTNHIGFFIAKALGFYHQHDIDLEILNPLEDNYAITPGKKLELDHVDFAIAPSETVISLNNKRNKVNAVAVYAILQEDLSSIASLKSSDLQSPNDLDGKIYASYNARYEDHIVRQMVKNDDGRGNFKIINPNKLGIWNTLLEGQADATWIFDNWEGVEADTKNVKLTKFKMNDYDIPYGYSPIVLTKKDYLSAQKDVYSKFITATQKGFLYVEENLEEAAAILKPNLTAYDLENIAIEKSLSMTFPYFGNPNNCGKMNPKKVHEFLQWLVDNQLEDKKILEQELFSNALF